MKPITPAVSDAIPRGSVGFLAKFLKESRPFEHANVRFLAQFLKESRPFEIENVMFFEKTVEICEGIRAEVTAIKVI